MIQSRIFNPIGGSLESLAMFLSIVIVLLVGLMLQTQNRNSKLKTFCFYFLLLASTFLLIIIDFTAAWVVLGSKFTFIFGLCFLVKDF